jgi:F-type H+-transporting ATPase subunit c
MFKKTLLTICSALFTLLVFAPAVLAAEALPSGDGYNKVFFAVGAMLAAGIGAGAGIGNAANGACMAVGRNPGVQGKIMTTMLVGMAMAESCVIYALVIGLVILYANPYAAMILK